MVACGPRVGMKMVSSETSHPQGVRRAVSCRWSQAAHGPWLQAVGTAWLRRKEETCGLPVKIRMVSLEMGRRFPRIFSSWLHEQATVRECLALSGFNRALTSNWRGAYAQRHSPTILQVRHCVPRELCRLLVCLHSHMSSFFRALTSATHPNSRR